MDRSASTLPCTTIKALCAAHLDAETMRLLDRDALIQAYFELAEPSLEADRKDQAVPIPTRIAD